MVSLREKDAVRGAWSTLLLSSRHRSMQRASERASGTGTERAKLGQAGSSKESMSLWVDKDECELGFAGTNLRPVTRSGTSSLVHVAVVPLCR